MIGVTAAEVVM